MKVNLKVISSALALSIALTGFSGTGSVQAQPINESGKSIIQKWEAPAGLSKKETVLAYVKMVNKQNSKGKTVQSGTDKISYAIVDEKADDKTGTFHYRLNQLYEGVPVYGADQAVSLDQNNDVSAYFGTVAADIGTEKISTKAVISADEAVRITKKAIDQRIGKAAYDNELKAEKYMYEHDGAFHLTYLVKASTSIPETGFWHYFIDAANGKVVDSFNAAHEVTGFGTGVFGAKQKFEVSFESGLYTMHDQTRGEGVRTYDSSRNQQIVSSNNKSFTDGAAVDAHANAQKTYDYFKKVFGRNSVDDNGQPLLSRVHYGVNWNNASWNGVFMSYGDGDGIRFHPLSAGLDVAAHEMSHGVIQHTANLIYRNESGALNESFADIFGAMVDRDDWLMGEDIMANGAIGLRSLEDPTDLIESRTGLPYPDHWSVRYTGTLDNGGVHINSSINNKAAYLISEGGEHYGVAVRGIGREKTEQIYYRALSYHLTSSSNFAMMRQAAIQAATELYGGDSDAVRAVRQAYNAVGVY